MLETLKAIMENIERIISFWGIVYLVYKSFRINFLNLYIDGKKIKLDKDEIKNLFRMLSLAKLSEINKGARVEHELEWKRNNLFITTKKGGKT